MESQILNTETQKVSLKNNKGEATGVVYVLKTTYFKNGKKSYFFVMQNGEFGKAYSFKHYIRLPKKIKKLFL